LGTESPTDIGQTGCEIYPDEYRVLECPSWIQDVINIDYVGCVHRGTAPIGIQGVRSIQMNKGFRMSSVNIGSNEYRLYRALDYIGCYVRCKMFPNEGRVLECPP